MRKLSLIFVGCFVFIGLASATSTEQNKVKEDVPVLCKVFPNLCSPTPSSGGNGSGKEPPKS